MFGDLFGYGSLTGETLELEKIKAQNLSRGANPAYFSDDFLADFPQFAVATPEQSPAIPPSLLQKLIDMANDSLSFSKYGAIWSFCMGLYIAHFITLFLAASQHSTSVPGLIAASVPPELMTSKTVGDVSAGYDSDAIGKDLEGFGAWKATTYGTQLATFANLAGMGGMTV